MDELLALKHTMKQYNTSVDNYKQGLLHYSMIQSMSGLIGLPPPPLITKFNIQETDVSLNNIKKYNIHFFDIFHTFFNHFLFLLIAAINTTSIPSENRENEP